MRKILFLILFLATTIGPYVLANNIETNEWGRVVNNIQIGIGMEGGETQIKTNQPFSLTIHIENTSTNTPFYFYRPLAIFNGYPITFVVISPSGKDVSPLPPEVEHGSGAGVRVLPNQIYEFEFNLGYLCKFDEAGTYKIVAKMNVSKVEHESIWAVSNPLYVTVIRGFWINTNAPPVGF